MKTKLSDNQERVMALFATGLHGQAIADILGIGIMAVYRRRTVALRKRRVATGVELAPPELRSRDDDETAADNAARLSNDISHGLRCPDCLIVLKESDCEERGECAARATDLLKGDAIDRIHNLWMAVQEGRNTRE